MACLQSCRPNPTFEKMNTLKAALSPAPWLQVSDLLGPDAPKRRLIHPGRWISGAIGLLFLALLIRAFAMGQIQWDVVGQFLTARVIVVEFGWTLLISACALAPSIALAKQNTQLRDAALESLKAMKADGTYAAILSRYGLQDAGVEEFTVNGVTK